MRVYPLLLAVLVVACCVPPASAENWPQFRGTDAHGVATTQGLPTEWGADQNIVWRAKLPGLGWSQPIVWGERIF